MSYGFKSSVKLGVEIIFFKIPIGRTVFNFSCKTSVFAGMDAHFEYKNDNYSRFFVVSEVNSKFDN